MSQTKGEIAMISKCPHCNSICNCYQVGTLERCLCGYWNDTRSPLRYADAQKQIDQMDRDILTQQIALMRPDYCSHRWVEKPFLTMDEKAERTKEYQKKWRAKNKDKLAIRRRELAILSSASCGRVDSIKHRKAIL
jgi:hypothetical protein